MAGTPLTIYGDGEQVRDFIHVSDVVRVTMKAMTTPMAGGDVFNICTGKGTSVRQLADDHRRSLPNFAGHDLPRSASGRRADFDRRPDPRLPAVRRAGEDVVARRAERRLAATRERQALQLRYA